MLSLQAPCEGKRAGQAWQLGEILALVYRQAQK